MRYTNFALISGSKGKESCENVPFSGMTTPHRTQPKSLKKGSPELTGDTLRHSPYSPSLTHSDYHLFGSMKDALHEHHFLTNENTDKTLAAHNSKHLLF